MRVRVCVVCKLLSVTGKFIVRYTIDVRTAFRIGNCCAITYCESAIHLPKWSDIYAVFITMFFSRQLIEKANCLRNLSFTVNGIFESRSYKNRKTYTIVTTNWINKYDTYGNKNPGTRSAVSNLSERVVVYFKFVEKRR